MTRAEAIEILKGAIKKPNTKDGYMGQAFDMAIKALEQQTCEDAVSRHDVMRTIDDKIDQIRRDKDKINEYYSHLSFVDGIYDGYCVLKCDLKILPSINPQPKTGKWIDIMVGDMPAQACDQCNTFYPLAYTGGGHKYCPNCGCRMVEPQERSE
jgi:hypothetical protein